MSRSPTPEARAVGELLAFRELLASGGLRRIGLGQPDYDPGERLLLRLPQTARRRIAIDADRAAIERREFLDDPSPLHTQGTLYVTDRRATLMGNRRKRLGEWRWDTHAEVKVIYGWAGVRFIAHDGDTESDAALHVYRPLSIYDESDQKVAFALMSVEAAYVMATGRDYDAWLATLPLRLR